MMIEISPINVYIGLILNGLATGIGASLGTYSANKHIIETGKNILKKIKKGFKKNGK